MIPGQKQYVIVEDGVDMGGFLRWISDEETHYHPIVHMS